MISTDTCQSSILVVSGFCLCDDSWASAAGSLMKLRKFQCNGDEGSQHDLQRK